MFPSFFVLPDYQNLKILMKNQSTIQHQNIVRCETSRANMIYFTPAVYTGQTARGHVSYFEKLVETITSRRVTAFSDILRRLRRLLNCFRKHAFLSVAGFQVIGPPRCFLLQQFTTATVRGFSRVTHGARACTCDHGACMCALRAQWAVSLCGSQQDDIAGGLRNAPACSRNTEISRCNEVQTHNSRGGKRANISILRI